MVEMVVFFYGLLAAFVLTSMHRNRKQARPSPKMVTAVGWGLFSMSSTLAVLLFAVALALSMGVNVPAVAAMGL
jgi:hypothetical protein